VHVRFAEDSRAARREPVISDAALEAAGCVLVVLDADGRVQQANAAAVALTGRSAAELRGRPLSEAVASAPGDAAGLRSEVFAAVGERCRRTFEQAEPALWWSLSPLVGADGSVAGVVGLALDASSAADVPAPVHLLQRVAMAANEAHDVGAAVAAVLRAVCEETGWPAGRAWMADEAGELRPLGKAEAAGPGRALAEAVLAAGQPMPGKSAFALPVLVGRAVVGVLEILTDGPPAVDGPLVELLGSVGAQVGRVVERAASQRRAADAAAAEAARLDAIVHTQFEIATTSEDVGQVMLLVVDRLMELTDAAGASLEVIDGDELVTRAATGVAVSWLGARRPVASYGGRCTATREPVVCPDVAEARAAGEPIAVPLTEGSFVAVPLLHEDRVVGLVRLMSPRRRAFNQREVSTARVLAGLAAAAMERAVEHAARQELLAERTAALARLSESEERFRKAFNDAPIGMALVALSPDESPGTLCQVNRSLASMTGRVERDLLAHGLLGVVHQEDVLGVRSMLRTVASDPDAPARSERRLVRPDGRVVWVAMSASAVVDADGGPVYAIVQAEDISQRKEAEAKLTEMALHDPLTGLPNRLLLLDRVHRALARARRRRTHVALLFCDLDRFKVINDSLGHETGDDLLVALARRLDDALRDQDTAARLGGDEFVVVCEDVADPDEAVAVAHRIQEVLEAPCAVDGGEVVLTTSIGIVMSTGYASPYALLRDADAAMYRAKETGPARVVVFDQELAAQAVDRLRTESGLRHALENGELRLHYQPIIGMRSGAIEGFEALLRWEHPERGLVMPDQFLAVAEETGLIVPIGSWVVEEACRQAAAWRRQYPNAAPWSMAVNLSARQVGRSGLANVVGNALRNSGLEPSWLCLELTEGVLIEATPAALAMLRSLKDLGVRLSIDDFGTGYSSLSYLRRFPIDVVKIDRSFVAGLGGGGEDDAIIGAVIGLTQRLGLRAVAEGVETEEQAARLRELGCDLMQGYLFARPQPAEDVAPLLASAAAASAVSA
jgi:diguanylate cyclase (GGDEF)-like protein/PAS domain S-box-containing protein